MDSTTGFFSGNQASVLKQKYRSLRSKILKILDEKFFHPSKDVAQYDSRAAQIQLSFKKAQDQEFINNPWFQKKTPKLYDYTQFNPNWEKRKYSVPEKPQKIYKNLEKLSIPNLCKYLSPEEIELVCEDPIYFLGRKEYRLNDALNDHKLWNIQLEAVKEKRIREANWKETMEVQKQAYLQTLTDEPDKKVAPSNGSSTARSAFHEDPKSTKDRAIRIYSRRIKARNNQMSAIVKIRRMEEEEVRRDKESEWVYRSEGKLERIMEKRKEAHERAMTEKGAQRVQLAKKFEIRDKQNDDKRAILKIENDILQFYRNQVSVGTKKHLELKSNKARTFSDFKLRKTFFASKLELQDRNFEDSRNISPL